MPALAQRASTRTAFSSCETDAPKRNLYRFRPASRTKPSNWSLTWIKGIALAVAALSFISPALATFPGQNGNIAYAVWKTGSVSSNIFTSGEGQLTQSISTVVGSFTEYSYDYGPAWSPDGNSVAFVRSLVDVDSIEIIGKDGTGLRQVLSAAAIPAALPFVPFPEPQLFHITSLAWSPDGQRISFFVNHSTDVGTGIWTVNVDGTGLTETVVGIAPNGTTTLLSPLVNSSGYGTGIRLAWSSNNQMVFACSFRSASSNGQRPVDLCVLDANGPRQLSINFADGTQGIPNFGSWPTVDWSPDGTKILFNAHIEANSFTSQLFTINPDGSALTQITNQTAGSCPPIEYDSAHYSPDGQRIAAVIAHDGLAANQSCGRTNLTPPALAVFNVPDGSPSVITSNPLLVFAGVAADESSESPFLDWQPIPEGLTIQYNDGHGDPLKGMKVELRAIDDTPLDNKPINGVAGTYVFENGGSYTGDFIVRATLIDNTAPQGAQPAFDIRFAASPTEPVWIENKITIVPGPPQTFVRSFSADSLELSNYGPQYPANPLNDLDSMAAIYFRLRQYIDWVAERIPISNIPTAFVYTFTTTDPDGSANADPLRDGAYYSSQTSKIVMNPAFSEYSDRDGVGNDEGPFVEWHEFTHHIYNSINNRASCRSPYTPHIGYNNPDTCDSLDEGFADFLPTYAGRELLGPTTVTLSGDIQYSSSSLFDSRWDLEWPIWPWTSLGVDNQGHNIGGEEWAFAEVLWNLTVLSGNTQTTGVIGIDGLPHVVTLTNTAPQISLSQLWTQLASLPTGTIAEFRKSFGSPTLTIDLDGDGIPDVAPIDIPFLMNGFYPIDSDQSSTVSRTSGTYFYDVGYAQRNGFGSGDGAVGLTSHYIYDPTNTTVVGQRIPRNDDPKVPNANIALTVLDASGAPLSGATAVLTISFPGGQTNMIRTLDSASGALVYLALPRYFNYLLPDGAALPACDPMRDIHVTVSITIVAQGRAATTIPSFDNCTYWHAVAAATGPAALSYTVTVPVIGNGGGDTIPPSTTLALSPGANSAGWNNSIVTATLAATDNAGGSGVKQITYSASGAQTIASTVVNGNSASFTISSEGVTTISFFGTDNAGNVESPNTQTIQLDKTPPSINCGAPDRIWHASDVNVACSAADLLSGLANSTDASFSLTTNVPAGTETSNAATGTHSVCDVAGNCAAAGPIVGNMVDRKAPSISIGFPAPGASYLLNQTVNANFACADGGSGVATCTGPVGNGSPISTAQVGSKTFTVNATDNVGNVAPAQTVSYSVTNAVCLLYDPTRSVQSGSTIPLKIQLCDANNADVSSSNVVVHALSLVQTGTNASAVLQPSGNANPDNDFRFDPTLGPTGGYIFNLSTKGLTTGSYQLTFTASSDPASHILSFQVR
jgi:hypothetical protein